LAKTYSILIISNDVPRCTRLAFVAGSGEPMRTFSLFNDREAAAAYLTQRLGRKVSVSALARLASAGGGPEYTVVLGRATYSLTALDRWFEAQTRPPSRERDCPLTQPAGGEDEDTPSAA
jgi:hypothetical protein